MTQIADELFSRTARLAALLTGLKESELTHLFTQKRILVRLEDALGETWNGRETFLLAVNEALRFCPNVAICLPSATPELREECELLAVGIHGLGHGPEVVGLESVRSVDAIVNVGTEVMPDLPWIAVNSSGWVARVATASSFVTRLHWERCAFNAIGATAAACLGVGAAFLEIVGQPIPLLQEISLFSQQVGSPGTLSTGPALPSLPVPLDGLLVGCGSVTHGWAYTVKRLPIVGTLQAVDRQALQTENLGTCAAATRRWVGEPKVWVIRELLAPAIEVTPRPEEFEFFKIRLQRGLGLPGIVVNGLDNVEARHSVQRLWPEVLIDMAAGALTSQVIVKERTSKGLCLLRALLRPRAEVTWAEKLAKETGLSVNRIVNEPTTSITQADIEHASAEKRAMLEKALGQQICGRITEHNLYMEGHDPGFAPAVPFVTTFSGVMGAAETMRWLLGYRYQDSLHFQKSFQSGQIRSVEMHCDKNCECQATNESSSGIELGVA